MASAKWENGRSCGVGDRNQPKKPQWDSMTDNGPAFDQGEPEDIKGHDQNTAGKLVVSSVTSKKPAVTAFIGKSTTPFLPIY